MSSASHLRVGVGVEAGCGGAAVGFSGRRQMRLLWRAVSLPPPMYSSGLIGRPGRAGEGCWWGRVQGATLGVEGRRARASRTGPQGRGGGYLGSGDGRSLAGGPRRGRWQFFVLEDKKAS